MDRRLGSIGMGPQRGVREGKRRGILVPVFLDEVEAPLAFRLLNGAQLWNWKPGEPNPEFDARPSASPRSCPVTGQQESEPLPPRLNPTRLNWALAMLRSDGKRWKSPWVVGGAGVFAALLLVAGYQWISSRNHGPAVFLPSARRAARNNCAKKPFRSLPANGSPPPGNEFSNLEAAL